MAGNLVQLFAHASGEEAPQQEKTSRKRQTARAPTEDVQRVFDAWRANQRAPRLCKQTAERNALISKRLKLGYTVDDLLALIRYAWEADAPGPRWWRGENPNGTRYLDLNNLLVEHKLGPRVQAALEWLESLQTPAAEVCSTHTAEETFYGATSRYAKLRTEKRQPTGARSIKRD